MAKLTIKANITVGWDSNGKQIRKSFGSYKKSVVLDKMNTAKYQAKTNSLSNSDINFWRTFLKTGSLILKR